MNKSVSNKQRIVLEDIYESEKHSCDGISIPLCIPNISSEVQFSFNTEGERLRFLENMVDRGLLVISRGQFLRLTDAGRAIVESGNPARRRKDPMYASQGDE